MDINQIIIGPKITEKSVAESKNSKFRLIVNIKAGKFQIKEAVKKIYNLEPIDVNIIKTKGRRKTTPTKLGLLVKRKYAKKFAIVELKKGQKIPGFEITK